MHIRPNIDSELLPQFLSYFLRSFFIYMNEEVLACLAAALASSSLPISPSFVSFDMEEYVEIFVFRIVFIKLLRVQTETVYDIQ